MLSGRVFCCQMFYQSLDRLLEYKELPQEGARVLAGESGRATEGWPTTGLIEFKAASLRYKPSLPLALREVTLTLPGGQHAGVVGRTGAGKSSLLALLFRLVEPAAGSVLIDGVDIMSLGLRRLRAAISVIPQDAVLMAGARLVHVGSACACGQRMLAGCAPVASPIAQCTDTGPGGLQGRWLTIWTRSGRRRRPRPAERWSRFNCRLRCWSSR